MKYLAYFYGKTSNLYIELSCLINFMRVGRYKVVVTCN